MNPARIRLYLDEDVPVQIAAPLRRAGFDVLTARESRRLRIRDGEQIGFAVQENRTLVTRNRNDFLEISKDFARSGRNHPGILILSSAFADTDYGGIARAIIAYILRYPEGIPTNLTGIVSPLKQG